MILSEPNMVSARALYLL